MLDCSNFSDDFVPSADELLLQNMQTFLGEFDVSSAFCRKITENYSNYLIEIHRQEALELETEWRKEHKREVAKLKKQIKQINEEADILELKGLKEEAKKFRTKRDKLMNDPENDSITKIDKFYESKYKELIDKHEKEYLLIVGDYLKNKVDLSASNSSDSFSSTIFPNEQQVNRVLDETLAS